MPTQIDGINDIAVSPIAPHPILVASESGRVDVLADIASDPTVSWECRGGRTLQVGWIGAQPVAWNSDPRINVFWILRSDGRTSPHPIPTQADIGLSDDGFYSSCAKTPLAFADVSRDGSITVTERSVPALGNYHPGSLTASRTGAIALETGGHVQLLTASGAGWQNVRTNATVLALSPSGRYLATSAFHTGTTLLHCFTVDRSSMTLRTEHPVRAMPVPVTAIHWSEDERMLLVFARDSHDVRVFDIASWAPGLWTHSPVAPRFRSGRVVAVDDGRSQLVDRAAMGSEARTWVRRLSTVDNTFKISGNSEARRGDKVIVFQQRPRTCPTAIYEIIDGPRKDDAHGASTAPVTCALRLAFPPPSPQLLDRDQADVGRLAEAEGGSVDPVWVRALLDRLLVEHETERAQLDVVLPVTPAISDVGLPTTALVAVQTPRSNDGDGNGSASDVAPSPRAWTQRWWRVPGESLLAERIGNADVAVDLAWVSETEWGLNIRFEQGSRETFFDVGPESLVDIDGIAPQVVDRLYAELAKRCRGLTVATQQPGDPIVATLARQFATREWTSGKRLRSDLKIGLRDFDPRVARLMPRLVRKSDDDYSLTLPGLLAAGSELNAGEIMEALYRAIAFRFEQDAEAEVFEASDLARFGMGDDRLQLAKNIARASLLIGANDDPNNLKAFVMPADAETIAEAVRRGVGFREYLVHAATERQRSQHYTIHRPWTNAPLWTERDGSPMEYPPSGFLWNLRRLAPESKPEAHPATEAMAPISLGVIEEPPIEIEGYEVVEKLPTGASGEVYRARENRDGGVERAIKVFVPHPFADDQDPEPRFRSEADALVRLQHRAIVRYVSSGVLKSGRAFYLVMELVSGASLRERYRSMSYETRIETMIEILGGVEHAHQSRIFHRDIKPSNIMIRDSDQQPVLVDFGLAYLLGDERDDDRTRSPPGTPGYIPPEVANDPKRSRDPRNDVFQAGVTLYQILMGQFPDKNLGLEVESPRLRDLDPVVRRAIAPDPDERGQVSFVV